MQHTIFGEIYFRWLQAIWIEDYWSSYDKAIAVTRMLQNNETSSKKFDHYWNDVSLQNQKIP